MKILESKVAELEKSVEAIERDLGQSVEELVADSLKTRGFDTKLDRVLTLLEEMKETQVVFERRLRWVEGRIEKRGRPPSVTPKPTKK